MTSYHPHMTHRELLWHHDSFAAHSPTTLRFQHNPYSADTPCRLLYTDDAFNISTSTRPTSAHGTVTPTLSMSLPSPQLSVCGHEECEEEYLSEAALSTHSVMDKTAAVPQGTLHKALAGRVSFVPYPTAEVMESPASRMDTRAETGQFCDTDITALDADLAAEAALAGRKRSGQRLFLGQLPLYVTEQQVVWLVKTVTGETVFGMEAIHSWGSGPKKQRRHGSPAASQPQQPKGCVHVYCDTDHGAETIVQLLGALHRVLIDDTGIFVATTEAEKEVLFEYCALMANDVTLRMPLRPFRPVVAQRATSTFVPVTAPNIVVVGRNGTTSPVPPTSATSAAVSAVVPPPPYYSCALQRLRQEATLPALPPQTAMCGYDTPAMMTSTPAPMYDPLSGGPAPSFRRQK